MTSRSSISKETEMNNAPFLLKPIGKDYLWGGNRLNDDFGKGIDMHPLAETWECSTHPDGVSLVASGQFAGKGLAEVLKLRPDFLGRHSEHLGELPILIKLIDAKRDLSVQVHPDDSYAKKHENGELGKTEMWYILDADDGAKLVYGLHRETSRDELARAIENADVSKYLQKLEVKKDDVFYIEAGTIHAIGAGILIAEIQENSNLTYRLYDYDRVDKDGNKRELHIDKALSVANLGVAPEPRLRLRTLRYKRGCASEFLCRCKYFQVERMLLNTERCREPFSMQSSELSFEVLLCVEGSGTIAFANEEIEFHKGDTVFVPANSVPMKIQAVAQLLRVSC